MGFDHWLNCCSCDCSQDKNINLGEKEEVEGLVIVALNLYNIASGTHSQVNRFVQVCKRFR